MPARIDGHGQIFSAAIAAVCLLCSAAQAEWASFSDSRGTSVQYPREVFSVAAGSGEPPGPMLQSADGRARLHVFTRPNERRASPAEFIRRAVTDQRQRLSYRRVTNRFLVFSAAEGDLILYRRCNFVRDGHPLFRRALSAGRKACVGCAGDADELFAEPAVRALTSPGRGSP